MDVNPYESPTTSNIGESVSARPGNELIGDWEYRRVWFNAVLVSETLLIGILPDQLIYQRRFWVFAIEGAFVANVCFCIGPVLTWYLLRFGFDSGWTGKIIFWTGTLLAMLLTFIATVINFTPWQD
jgi:hypothetical protein